MRSSRRSGCKLNFPDGRSPHRARVADILCYAILLIGIGTVFSAAYLTKTAYSIVPMWDDWKLLDGYIHQPHLGWIWEQLNEHRIIFYKLLLIAELRFFRGSGWPAFIVIYCCQISSCLLFGYMLRKFGGFKGPLWAACFGLALYTYFCPCQWENFALGIQVSFLLVSVWMMIALVGVLLQSQRIVSGQPGGRGILIISLLAAAGATFCGANGMVVWIVALLAALFARLPWRRVAWYLVGMAVVSPLYFIGYHSPATHASPVATLRQPVGVLEYMEKLFGGVILPNSRLDWALQVGQLALGFSLFLLARFVIRRGRNNLLEIGLASITIYSLATGFLTALGRLILGTDSAFTTRYQAFSLQFWLAISVWTIFILAQQRATKSLSALLVASATLLASSIGLYQPVLEVARAWAFERRESPGLLLIANIRDDNIVKTMMFRIPEMVWGDADYLRARHLSLFSTPISGQIGMNLTPTYSLVSADKCGGYVGKVSSVGTRAEGLKLEGWTVDRLGNYPVKRMLFAAGERIVGFGVLGVARPDVATALHSNHAFRSGWVGYAKVPEGTKTLDVYGILDSSGEKDICPVATVQIGFPLPTKSAPMAARSHGSGLRDE